jgi:hypothetical protein
MTPSQSSFSESLARSADRQQQQMWQAARTVRAHVGADDVQSMLECLGLTDAVQPETQLP